MNPTQRVYHPPIGLHGSLDPTPPPEIVAATKYTYEERGEGNDARLKMWVTSVHRVGPVMMCDGWLVRYPVNPNASRSFGNGTQISIGGSRPAVGTLPPVVEAGASIQCAERELQPFAPSPSASP